MASNILFVDESGDLGGKHIKKKKRGSTTKGKGSHGPSQYFVLTGICVSPLYADTIRGAVTDILKDLRREKPSLQELKGQYLKDDEFISILNLLHNYINSVDIYFIYISKNSIDFAKFVDGNQDKVYSILLVNMIDQFKLNPSKIIIDPSQYADFARDVLLRYYNYSSNDVVINTQSVQEPVLQFVDVVSNAFFKSVEFKKNNIFNVVQNFWNTQRKFLYDKFVKREFHRLLSQGIF